MRRISLLLGVLLLPATIACGQFGAPAVTLDGILDAKGAVWGQTANEFMDDNRAVGFRWESSAQDSARAAHPDLTFLEMPVYEAVMRFEKGAPKQLTMYIYNRGDAGDMELDAFEKLLNGVDEKLAVWTGGKGILLKTQERTASATIRQKSWVKEPYRIDLVWSLSEKTHIKNTEIPSHPEFARLQITKFDPAQDPRKSILATGTASQPKTISALELKARVEHKTDGDAVITSVPMVDQGKKGYCADAVAERVLRYYGRTVDQHEIAQLAASNATTGTTFEQMVAALRRIGDQTHMDLSVLQEFQARDFEKTISDYNRAAKHAHVAEVEMMMGPLMAYHEMNMDILKEVRVKRDGPMGDFKTKITNYINNGVPLTWGCVVGKAPEKPEIKGFGGHMRLIIGYNDRTGEILYTDTWGAGHELKRMSLANAWTITLGLYCFQPSNLHF